MCMFPSDHPVWHASGSSLTVGLFFVTQNRLQTMTRVNPCHWSNQRYELACANFLCCIDSFTCSQIKFVSESRSGPGTGGEPLASQYAPECGRRDSWGQEKVAYFLGLQMRVLWRIGSRAGMDCHRRHRNSIGTPCADPMNSKSMSLTQRGDTYTGTLRLHDTHGVCAYMHFSLVSRILCLHFATVSCHNMYNCVIMVIIVW